MAPKRKLNVVIVEPDSSLRMRLKQATNSLGEFGQTLQVPGLADVQRKLDEEHDLRSVDILFVSSRFPRESIKSFTATALRNPKTQDAAFVMLIEQAATSSSVMGEMLLCGADAFLCEPYSVDELVKMCAIASSVRKDRSAAREAAALKLILADITKGLDVVWQMHALNYQGGVANERFKQNCSKLGFLNSESLERLQNLIIDTFEQSPVPLLPARPLRYEGKSARARQKAEKVMVARLHQENSDYPSIPIDPVKSTPEGDKG